MLKKFSAPILLLFWAYTWHAYAVGAVHRHPDRERTRAVYEKFSESGLLSKIVRKTQFKRRPFLLKGEAAVLDAPGPGQDFVPVLIQARAAAVRPPVLFERAQFLRSPPEIFLP